MQQVLARPVPTGMWPGPSYSEQNAVLDVMVLCVQQSLRSVSLPGFIELCFVVLCLTRGLHNSFAADKMHGMPLVSELSTWDRQCRWGEPRVCG